ncbi:hypothetical protein [Yoonia sp. SS1-5]|uniref:Uncharacterized protein n=1 Tax=Yoonia rhodophyticola TaxID=3137370 RepID=A0AAN0NJI0_9RHOB
MDFTLLIRQQVVCLRLIVSGCDNGAQSLDKLTVIMSEWLLQRLLIWYRFAN